MGISTLSKKRLSLFIAILLVVFTFTGNSYLVQAKVKSRASHHGANSCSKGVTLKVDGMDATLSNGLIKMDFGSDGSVHSLVKDGKELVGNLRGASRDPDKNRTFYVDYNSSGVHELVPDELKVIKNTSKMAHIAYVDTTDLLNLEYHIIMMKGESGIYSYVVAKNENEQTESIAELRSIYRFDRNIFDHAYMSEKAGIQPRYEDLEQMTKIQDETWRLPDGSSYTKYDYAGYFKENPVWGHFGNGFGAWFIPVSTEYYSGGPLKQELLVHQDAIALNYMTGAHFGTGNMTAPSGWQKLYGPWFVYINTGDNNTVVKDAKRKALKEQAKWPYQWMDDSLYPLNRATVKGKLKVTDGRSVSGATVVLAQPGGEPYKQTTGYIFYSKTDKNGNFTISNVRPGNYALYAYSSHGSITDQLEKDNIKVAGSIKDIGTITWSPFQLDNYIWQIGKSDHMAEEFKFGNTLRSYDLSTNVPPNLTYTIGSSNARDDWYYAQTKKGSWSINFNLDKQYNGNAYLKVALAAASSNPKITIKVNGTVVKNIAYTDNDQAIYRSANRSGRYHLEDIQFNASLLKNGLNTVTFSLTGGSVMYDTIILGTDDVGDVSTIQQLIRDGVANQEISPLFAEKLIKPLYQAQIAIDRGKNAQAAGHIKHFIKLLKGSSDRHIKGDAKEILHTDAVSLLNK